MTDPAASPPDLSTLGAPAATAATSTVIVSDSIAEKPYDPTQDRELVRGQIAMTLIWVLVGIVGAAMLLAILTFVGCHARDACTVETVELRSLRTVIELVLTPVVGLVGAVTGFYFGEKSGSTKSGG